jgi:hypothetical protein
MKMTSLLPFDVANANWLSYDVIFLASGFEERSVNIFNKIPDNIISKCTVLGFDRDIHVLSREKNDAIYMTRGLTPFVAKTNLEYEDKIRNILFVGAGFATNRPLRILIDYSAMTRSWYAYILTWIEYSGDTSSVEVDFVYSHGRYLDDFSALEIKDTNIISGFEGVSAGTRGTVAFYGLGYDKYATLTVHDIIQPDSFVCYVARDGEVDVNSQYVLRENSEIIEMSCRAPVFVPLSDLSKITQTLCNEINSVSLRDEVIAVPMGPKTHVLATLMVAQALPRVTCMHALGFRSKPVQVESNGVVSCWKATFVN